MNHISLLHVLANLVQITNTLHSCWTFSKSYYSISDFSLCFSFQPGTFLSSWWTSAFIATTCYQSAIKQSNIRYSSTRTTNTISEQFYVVIFLFALPFLLFLCFASFLRRWFMCGELSLSSNYFTSTVHIHIIITGLVFSSPCRPCRSWWSRMSWDEGWRPSPPARWSLWTACPQTGRWTATSASPSEGGERGGKN